MVFIAVCQILIVLVLARAIGHVCLSYQRASLIILSMFAPLWRLLLVSVINALFFLFNFSITSQDPNATLVQNIGRAIFKKKTIKISGNEVLSVDDWDVWSTYGDLW